MIVWPTKIKIYHKIKNEWKKWVMFSKGSGTKMKWHFIPCQDHFFAWSGKIPCTGVYRCIYCGKPN